MSGWIQRRILWRHLIPHVVPTMLVWGTLGISTTVLQEASLSFLGVGVQPPTPSLGGMINESQSFIQLFSRLLGCYFFQAERS